MLLVGQETENEVINIKFWISKLYSIDMQVKILQKI